MYKDAVPSILVAIVLLTVVVIAQAQQPNKVYRIGYLSSGSGTEGREKTIHLGLRELGYIEGQNAVIEWRFAKGNADRLPELHDRAGRAVVMRIWRSASGLASSSFSPGGNLFDSRMNAMMSI